MWRKMACAAGGLVLACAAAYFAAAGFGGGAEATSFDLRWLYPAPKGDRLPLGNAEPKGDVVMAFHLPERGLTVVAKGRVQRPAALAVDPAPRPQSRPANPVREVPNEVGGKKERLPEGCEPAFSPVTVPALAHVGARCDS